MITKIKNVQWSDNYNNFQTDLDDEIAKLIKGNEELKLEIKKLKPKKSEKVTQCFLLIIKNLNSDKKFTTFAEKWLLWDSDSRLEL